MCNLHQLFQLYVSIDHMTTINKRVGLYSQITKWMFQKHNFNTEQFFVAIVCKLGIIRVFVNENMTNLNEKYEKLLSELNC